MMDDSKNRQFKFEIFAIAFVVISILTGLSFLAEFGRDEGTLGDGLIWNGLADSFNFFRLPTHGLFWNLIIKHMGLYFPGLILNVLFWSIVSERLVTLTTRAVRNYRLRNNAC